MTEAEYQKLKRRIWRLTGQGQESVDAVYEKMLEEEAKGKTGDEIMEAVRELVQRMVRALMPTIRLVVSHIERESGMAFEDFVWLQQLEIEGDEEAEA